MLMGFRCVLVLPLSLAFVLKGFNFGQVVPLALMFVGGLNRV